MSRRRSRAEASPQVCRPYQLHHWRTSESGDRELVDYAANAMFTRADKANRFDVYGDLQWDKSGFRQIGEWDPNDDEATERDIRRAADRAGNTRGRKKAKAKKARAKERGGAGQRGEPVRARHKDYFVVSSDGKRFGETYRPGDRLVYDGETERDWMHVPWITLADYQTVPASFSFVQQTEAADVSSSSTEGVNLGNPGNLGRPIPWNKFEPLGDWWPLKDEMREDKQESLAERSTTALRQREIDALVADETSLRVVNGQTRVHKRGRNNGNNEDEWIKAVNYQYYTVRVDDERGFYPWSLERDRTLKASSKQNFRDGDRIVLVNGEWTHVRMNGDLRGQHRYSFVANYKTGSGKSFTIMNFLRALQSRGQSFATVIVIAPIAAMEGMKSDFLKCFGLNGENLADLPSYIHFFTIERFLKREQCWDRLPGPIAMVVDEAHEFRNYTSQGRRLLAFIDKYVHTVALMTATIFFTKATDIVPLLWMVGGRRDISRNEDIFLTGRGPRQKRARLDCQFSLEENFRRLVRGKVLVHRGGAEESARSPDQPDEVEHYRYVKLGDETMQTLATIQNRGYVNEAGKRVKERFLIRSRQAVIEHMIPEMVRFALERQDELAREPGVFDGYDGGPIIVYVPFIGKDSSASKVDRELAATRGAPAVNTLDSDSESSESSSDEDEDDQVDQEDREDDEGEDGSSLGKRIRSEQRREREQQRANEAGIHRVRDELVRNGVDSANIHEIFGALSEQDRIESLRDYRDGERQWLLLGPAGVQSLNTKGSRTRQMHVFTEWARATTLQTIGRGARKDTHPDVPNVEPDAQPPKRLDVYHWVAVAPQWDAWLRFRTPNGSFQLSGSVDWPPRSLSPPISAEVGAEVGAYYFNVHSPSFPAGEIRGQLAADVDIALRGDFEVPSVSTSAVGMARVQVRGGKLFYKLVHNITDATVVHIHTGQPGENGPPAYTLCTNDVAGKSAGKSAGENACVARTFTDDLEKRHAVVTYKRQRVVLPDVSMIANQYAVWKRLQRFNAWLEADSNELLRGVSGRSIEAPAFASRDDFPSHRCRRYAVDEARCRQNATSGTTTNGHALGGIGNMVDCDTGRRPLKQLPMDVRDARELDDDSGDEGSGNGGQGGWTADAGRGGKYAAYKQSAFRQTKRPADMPMNREQLVAVRQKELAWPAACPLKNERIRLRFPSDQQFHLRFCIVWAILAAHAKREIRELDLPAPPEGATRAARRKLDKRNAKAVAAARAANLLTELPDISPKVCDGVRDDFVAFAGRAQWERWIARGTDDTLGSYKLFAQLLNSIAGQPKFEEEFDRRIWSNTGAPELRDAMDERIRAYSQVIVRDEQHVRGALQNELELRLRLCLLLLLAPNSPTTSSSGEVEADESGAAERTAARRALVSVQKRVCAEYTEFRDFVDRFGMQPTADSWNALVDAIRADRSIDWSDVAQQLLRADVRVYRQRQNILKNPALVSMLSEFWDDRYASVWPVSDAIRAYVQEDRERRRAERLARERAVVLPRLGWYLVVELLARSKVAPRKIRLPAQNVRRAEIATFARFLRAQSSFEFDNWWPGIQRSAALAFESAGLGKRVRDDVERIRAENKLRNAELILADGEMQALVAQTLRNIESANSGNGDAKAKAPSVFAAATRAESEDGMNSTLLKKYVEQRSQFVEARQPLSRKLSDAQVLQYTLLVCLIADARNVAALSENSASGQTSGQTSGQANNQTGVLDTLAQASSRASKSSQCAETTFFLNFLRDGGRESWWKRASTALAAYRPRETREQLERALDSILSSAAASKRTLRSTLKDRNTNAVRVIDDIVDRDQNAVAASVQASSEWQSALSQLLGELWPAYIDRRAEFTRIARPSSQLSIEEARARTLQLCMIGDVARARVAARSAQPAETVEELDYSAFCKSDRLKFDRFLEVTANAHPSWTDWVRELASLESPHLAGSDWQQISELVQPILSGGRTDRRKTLREQAVESLLAQVWRASNSASTQGSAAVDMKPEDMKSEDIREARSRWDRKTSVLLEAIAAFLPRIDEFRKPIARPKPAARPKKERLGAKIRNCWNGERNARHRDGSAAAQLNEALLSAVARRQRSADGGDDGSTTPSSSLLSEAALRERDIQSFADDLWSPARQLMMLRRMLPNSRPERARLMRLGISWTQLADSAAHRLTRDGQQLLALAELPDSLRLRYVKDDAELASAFAECVDGASGGEGATSGGASSQDASARVDGDKYWCALQLFFAHLKRDLACKIGAATSSSSAASEQTSIRGSERG